MTPTRSQRRLVSSIIPIFILFSIALAHATTEDNYKTDNNFLTDLSESTHIENGYQTNIIINPCMTGIYANENGYQLDLAINPNGIGGKLAENNYRLDLIPETTFPDNPDLAIIDIAPYKTIVGEGYVCKINLTVSNQGLYYKTFYVNIYANTTTIDAQTITLTSKDHKTMTFTWNTNGVAYSNYTISAYITPVPSETDLSDNTLTNGVIMVSIPGDANGDRIVDIFDIGTISAHWYPGPPIGPLGYHPDADINNDGSVDIFDIGITSAHWGQSW